MTASENVTWKPRNNGDPCHLGTTTATGQFTTNGVGGVVKYQWIRQDSSGTWPQPIQTVTIAVGDKSVHAVVTDTFSPQSSGTDKLVFLQPGSPTVTGTNSWTCGH